MYGRDVPCSSRCSTLLVAQHPARDQYDIIKILFLHNDTGHAGGCARQRQALEAHHGGEMRRARRLLLAGGLALGAWAVAASVRPRLAEIRRTFRTSSSPGAAVYDVLAGMILGGYYDDIAADCAAALDGVDSPAILEVGPGPGHLAERLLTLLPDGRWTGLDIDRAMLDAAERRLAGEGLEARSTAVEGDVTFLPFDDASFDLVVSRAPLARPGGRLPGDQAGAAPGGDRPRLRRAEGMGARGDRFRRPRLRVIGLRSARAQPGARHRAVDRDLASGAPPSLGRLTRPRRPGGTIVKRVRDRRTMAGTRPAGESEGTPRGQRCPGDVAGD
jgi:hypothetical protein